MFIQKLTLLNLNVDDNINVDINVNGRTDGWRIFLGMLSGMTQKTAVTRMLPRLPLEEGFDARVHRTGSVSCSGISAWWDM